MIEITWHLLVLLLVIIAGLCYALTRSNESGMFGSPRGWVMLLWATATVVILLIYGGFCWW